MSKEYVVLAPGSAGIAGGFTGLPEEKFQVFQYMGQPPITRGIVLDWKSLQQQLRHVYLDELGVASRRPECPLLLLCSAGWCKSDLELATKICFESLNVPGLAIVPASVASLLGTNCTSGLVVDIGQGSTDIVPILDSKPVYFASRCIPLGVTDVNMNVDILFDMEQEHDLTSCIVNTLYLIPPHLRTHLVENIVVAGVGSKIINIRDRIRMELKKTYLAFGEDEHQIRDCKFRMIPEYLESYADRPELSAYLGAQMICKVVFPDSKAHVSRDEYETFGPAIIHTKNYSGISVQ